MRTVEKSKLLESVKNKDYFDQAKEWYYYRYLFCIIERSWLLLIVLLLLVCVFSLLLNIYLLFPITQDQNFVKYVSHTGDEFSLKKKLSINHKENEHVAIARYLVQKYVELYESYQTVQQSFQESFIKSHSTRQIRKKFSERMVNEVSTYPRKVFNIEISKLAVEQSILNLELNGSATITFTTEQNKKIIEQTVEMGFILSNIQEGINMAMPFKFMVKGYELKSR